MDSKKCFIIQPFDEAYIKRCDETYKPAIEQAGLFPYRVDEHYDPHKLKIQQIWEEIKNSDVCLAEITKDNPNVWYEYGFADGRNIPIVLICEDGRRGKLPFDVNQKDVYFYKTNSQGDWNELQKEIKRRLEIATQNIEIAKLTDPVSASLNLDEMRQHTLTALVIIASNADLDEGVSLYTLKRDMNNAGFNDLATNLALRELVLKEFITKQTEGYDNFCASCTEIAMEWLSENQDSLNLKVDTSRTEELSDDDIPF